MTYNPFTRDYRLSPGDVDVNYILCTRRPDEA